MEENIQTVTEEKEVAVTEDVAVEKQAEPERKIAKKPANETPEEAFRRITESTEEILRAKGYINVIRAFMSRIGKSCIGDILTEEKLDATVKDAQKYGIRGIMYTPFFTQIADGYFKKNPTSVKKTVIVDYPYGESSFGARAEDCVGATP